MSTFDPYLDKLVNENAELQHQCNEARDLYIETEEKYSSAVSRITELEARLADTEADSAQLISEIRLRRTAEARLARGRECIGHLIGAVDAIQREASKVCGGLPPMISWHWIKDSYVEIIKESRSVLSDTTPPLAVKSATVKADERGYDNYGIIHTSVGIPEGTKVTLIVIERTTKEKDK